MLNKTITVFFLIGMVIASNTVFSMENTEERLINQMIQTISDGQYFDKGTIDKIGQNSIVISETELVFAIDAKFLSQDGGHLTIYDFTVGEKVTYTATSEGTLLQLRKTTGGKNPL